MTQIETIDRLYSELECICMKHACAATLWGSYIRGEVTPNSDVDILVFSLDNIQLNTILDELQNILPQISHLDVSICSMPLLDFANENGTNYHSLFFSSKIVGENKTRCIFEEERNRIRKDKKLQIREFFNLFTSYIGLARVITPYDNRYSKFCMNGTNKWVRLFQAAQIRWPQLIGYHSTAILSFMCNNYHISYDSILQAYQSDLQYRISSEKGKKQYVNTDSVSLYWQKLFNLFFFDSVTWVQTDCGISVDLYYVLFKKLGMQNIPLIPESLSINKKAEAVVEAFVAENDVEIERLYNEHIDDWWVLTNLCVNPNTSDQLLEKIVFPETTIDPILWKSIRLYVAKNKNTSRKTLQMILNTKGLREQDYEAAKSTLFYKSQIEK